MKATKTVHIDSEHLCSIAGLLPLLAVCGFCDWYDDGDDDDDDDEYYTTTATTTTTTAAAAAAAAAAATTTITTTTTTSPFAAKSPLSVPTTAE